MESKEPLAALRKAAGLTIQDMATRLKVNKTTVIRWQKGLPRIPGNRLRDVADVLGVNPIALRPDIFEDDR